MALTDHTEPAAGVCGAFADQYMDAPSASARATFTDYGVPTVTAYCSLPAACGLLCNGCDSGACDFQAIADQAKTAAFLNFALWAISVCAYGLGFYASVRAHASHAGARCLPVCSAHVYPRICRAAGPMAPPNRAGRMRAWCAWRRVRVRVRGASRPT